MSSISDEVRVDEVTELTRRTACARSWLAGDYAYLHAAHVAENGESFILRLAGHNPAKAFVVDHVFAPSFRVLERMTHGRLQIHPIWDGKSHSLKDGWKALRDGKVEMTACYASTDAEALGFDLVQGLYLPGLFPNAHVATLASEMLFIPYLRPEYERHGVRMGRLKATDQDIIFSTRPVRRIEDFSGLRLATGPGWQGAVYRSLGAEVITIPSDGLRHAFEAGEVDAAVMTDGSCKVFGVCDFVRYRVDASLGRLNLEYCLAPQAYDQLPPDLRAAFNAWLRGLSQAESQVFYGLGGAVARQAFRRQGMEFVELEPNEMARWQQRIAGVTEDFITQMEARGKPARRFIADARVIAKAYAPASGDHLMQRAIFCPATGISDASSV